MTTININIFSLDSIKAEGMREILTALGILNEQRLEDEDGYEYEEEVDFNVEDLLEILKTNPSSLREEEESELTFKSREDFGERVINGAKVIIYYPENSDDWNALKAQRHKLTGYRVRDPEGVIHIFPNLLRFCREKNIVDCHKFASIARGTSKKVYEDLPWVCVDEEYSWLQPYKNLLGSI